jgi:CRP/FNR family transcriptional regulator, cyclic AMP receptor protein
MGVNKAGAGTHPPLWIFDPSQRLATAKMVQPSEARPPSFSAPNQQELAAMLIPESTAFQNSLGGLPVVTYQPGEMVIADGSKTGRLLILKKGTVTIEKEGTEIAKVTEPGAVFGELSVLLDQPHAADVRALESSQFHVANAATLLEHNPMAVLYVATVLARRLEGANHALIELKSQLNTGEPHDVVAKTVGKMEKLLAVSCASLVYAGYPYDPFS